MEKKKIFLCSGGEPKSGLGETRTESARTCGRGTGPSIPACSAGGVAPGWAPFCGTGPRVEPLSVSRRGPGLCRPRRLRPAGLGIRRDSQGRYGVTHRPGTAALRGGMDVGPACASPGRSARRGACRGSILPRRLSALRPPLFGNPTAQFPRYAAPGRVRGRGQRARDQSRDERRFAGQPRGRRRSGIPSMLRGGARHPSLSAISRVRCAPARPGATRAASSEVARRGLAGRHSMGAAATVAGIRWRTLSGKIAAPGGPAGPHTAGPDRGHPGAVPGFRSPCWPTLLEFRPRLWRAAGALGHGLGRGVSPADAGC